MKFTNPKAITKNPIRQEKSTINFAFACIASTKKILKGEKLTKNNIFLEDPE